MSEQCDATAQLQSNSHPGNLRRLSHCLSWALRHKALELGLTITKDGYVPIQEILGCSHSKFRNSSGASIYTIDDIRAVVRNCDKQRYKLAELPASNFYPNLPDGEPHQTILCIRANQGHSIPLVDPDLLLERLSSEELSTLPVVVHGTNREAWEKIQQSKCLSRMSRNQIHFATGLPKDNGIISGMRKSCEVYIYIDTEKCAKDDVPFYRSDNGVVLSAGVSGLGTLPFAYFLRVTDNQEGVLWPAQVETDKINE